MSTAAPTFAEPDSDAWGALAASPLAPARRRAIFGTVLAISLIAHGMTVLLFLAADSLDGRLVTTVQEIPVELVKEMPETTSSAAGAGRDKADGEKDAAHGADADTAAAKANTPASAAKPEARKTDAAPVTPPAAPADAAKPELPQQSTAASRPQPELARPEAAKPEAAKPEAAKPEAAKPEAAKPTTAKPSAGSSPALSAAAARPAPRQATQPAPAAAPATPARSAPPALSMPTAFGPLPGSFNAVILPATTIGGQEAVSYRALVFSQIAKAKRFPEAARARGASGVAVVSFSVDDTGNPVGVTLAHSSGDPDIDAEIVAMVGRAAPFPPPPQGAQRSFSAAIEFGHDE